MEKTIEVNESRTVKDITVTLERIELTSREMKIYAFVTQPDYPPTVQSSPFWNADSEYSIDDGPAVNLPHPGMNYMINGTRFLWGGTTPKGTLDPVPSDAHELILKINSMKVSASPDDPQYSRRPLGVQDTAGLVEEKCEGKKMKKLITLIILILTSVLLFGGCSSGGQEPLPLPQPSPGPGPSSGTTGESGLEGFQRMTLEEASQTIGMPVYAPAYLPEGYEIRGVYLKDAGSSTEWIVVMLFSDEEIIQKDGKYNEKMRLTIYWYDAGGLKMPWAERVQIGDSYGMLEKEDDHNDLSWIVRPGRKLVLSAEKGIPTKELAKIAESVVPPPEDMLAAEISPVESIVVSQGETGTLTISLTSQALKTLEVSVSQIETQLPGVSLKITPDAFSLNPGERIEVKADVKVSPTAPSPSWPRWTPPMEKEPFPPPPSLAITEPAYYRLTFDIYYTYAADGEKKSDKVSVGIKLRFKEPPSLPPGMVTLEEAQKAVKFPIAIQLPAYLPEGTEPPFLGLTLTSDQPRGATVHYATFDVILIPEPGVTGPPRNMAGERTTIHKKPGIIGTGRVDWWAYDLHYAIVSDQVPTSEQLLIAESMMQIAPGSGSWLEK